ncbi:hypothetical protein [Rouxiella badensis]|uniref:transcriptional antitermination N peptide n=1 Tax=Rouxiella badensis TaxID=1646377 RepID=UPI003C4A9EA9
MTRRTQFNGTAATRRREARQHLQALPVNDFSTELSVEPAKPSKVELSCKRKPVGRVDKALSIPTEKHYPSADNICLPQVAIFAAGHRKPVETVTAR